MFARFNREKERESFKGAHVRARGARVATVKKSTLWSLFFRARAARDNAIVYSSMCDVGWKKREMCGDTVARGLEVGVGGGYRCRCAG